MCNVLIINVLHTPNTPFNYFEASHIDLSSGIFNFLFFRFFRFSFRVPCIILHFSVIILWENSRFYTLLLYFMA